MKKFKNAIVLTGGIGTGKSTVASFLKMFGYKIIDADAISKEVFEKNKDKIKSLFGTVDRKELRKIVFNNKEKLKLLEEIILPEVKKEVLKLAKKYEKDDVVYFVDLPLFFEKQDSYKEFKRSVLIYATKELQLQRLMKRDGLSKEEALLRLKAQMPIDEKKSLATKVVDNTKDLPHLQNEIDIITQWAKEI